MNRNEAKIFASIPREKLAVIEPKLDKHYDLICAFANGAEIEVFRGMGYWETQEEPKFLEDFKYRVKPRSAQHAEPWKPKEGEKFFCLHSDTSILSTVFRYVHPYEELLSAGNCFRTREEAEAARERVRAALKGETLSKTETVENKSHVVELSEKLGEPSIAVFHCDGKGGEGGAILRGRGAAVELDGDKERVLTGLGFLFISLFRRGFKADALEKVLEISTKHFYEHGKKIKVEKIEV